MKFFKVHLFFLSITILQIASVFAMEQESNHPKHSIELQFDHIKNALESAIKKYNNVHQFQEDVLFKDVATTNIDFKSIFEASEGLLCSQLALNQHPLFASINDLKSDETFVITVTSGPTVEDFTNIILNQHDLEFIIDHKPSLKIFKNAETFLRCLDIFKRKYQEMTGISIDVQTSFALKHMSLADFCDGYIKRHPQLTTMSMQELKRFIRLLAVFVVGDNVVDMDITLKISKDGNQGAAKEQRSFYPLMNNNVIFASQNNNEVSNEISLGQKNLNKQIQNLSGSELAMPFIKDADGKVQFEALQSMLNRKQLNMVELGGGRGETNAVPKAIQDQGVELKILNVEPHGPFAQPYIEEHKGLGIKDVDVLQKTAQELSIEDVINHFGGKKADIIFASHSFYFLLGDMYKATQEYIYDSAKSITKHPLCKFFDMLADDGVILITLQSGAGARLFRNALLGNHGLDKVPSNIDDEVTSMLSSFGGMATFLRYFELFTQRYYEETGTKINIKMHYAVANVPLDDFVIKQDPETQGYCLHNPLGQDADQQWLSPKMMDFYGNWKELQAMSTLTFEKAQKMDTEDLKKLGINKIDPELLISKQKLARKTQEIFLHILPLFALGNKNMQHPNITLEITAEHA